MPVTSRALTLAVASLLVAAPLACSSPGAPEPAPKANAEAAQPAAATPAAGAEVAEAALPEAAEAAEAAPAPSAAASGPVVEHVVETLEGGELALASLRGKAVLVVNTASECGYTPQYAQLQELYGRYRDRGLVVIGFPSNDFGGQEPGDADQIKGFVQSEYAVEFPMMAKVHARGPEIAPVYKTLSEETGDGIRGEVKWNFTKFLIDPEGRVIARFEPAVEPMADEVIKAVEAALPKAG
ncbi:MAG: glutathione peroxidase [Myxococcales bacterium]|nr:glutathione peroxidase [Myxococcales bacterium]MCB9706211.1 glutathione peroxidase [Myxococcales bacterium]